MIAKRKGQNSLGGTTGCDVYEVRPHKSGHGVDLISDRFRYGPIWYAGPDAVRGRVREVPLSIALAAGTDPRVGRFRRCNPDALIQRRFSPVAKGLSGSSRKCCVRARARGEGASLKGS
jgi:hypothetical protein